MDLKKIVVVVEDVDAARTALLWALHNLLRYGDIITLLHVFPRLKSRNRKKIRMIRLKGYQLALSFKEICNNNFLNTNVEIIVTEGDAEGNKTAEIVREMGASALVIGLHDQSFLYKLALSHNNIASYFNCRVLTIKQPPASPQPRAQNRAQPPPPLDSSTNMDFSRIEIARSQSFSHIDSDALMLQESKRVPDIPPPKIPYRICPDPSAIIWRSRKSRSKGRS